MEFLTVFFILFITSVSYTLLFKKRIEQVIPITTVTIILIIYIVGLLDHLKLGVLFVTLGAFIQLIYIAIYFTKNVSNLKDILAQILTPGLFLYIGLFILSIVVNKGRIFEDYDEYNHWGIIIKNMFLYNNYGTNPESLVAFNEYPPFTAIFQYLFIQIKGVFVEDVIITAHNILYFSLIIPITKHITWKKNIKQMLLAIMVIVLVPIIFYPNFYTNILVDGILGIAFTYVLYSAYREEDNSQFQFLEIFCGMTILLLTKTQGIGLAILAMIIILFQLWLERKKQKQTVRKKVKLLFFSVICAVMLLSIWNIKIRKEQHRWDFTRMYQEQSVETTKKVTKEFIHAIFKGKFITERKVTAFCVIIGIFALMLVHYKQTGEKHKKYRYYILSMAIGTLVYLIGMLWMYCTIFEEDEALILASFARYIFTIVLADTMFFSFVLLEGKVNKVMTITVMIIITMMLPFYTLQKKYISKKDYIVNSHLYRLDNMRNEKI